jgi:hypothetical protein
MAGQFNPIQIERDVFLRLKRVAALQGKPISRMTTELLKPVAEKLEAKLLTDGAKRVQAEQSIK